MSTNGTIAFERADGTVAMIYSHWDSYLDCNGNILQKHYSDPILIQQLLDLGNVASLGAELGDAHEFDQHFLTADPRSRWCTFYGRDRGESDVEAIVFDSYSHYCRDAELQEYNYLFRSGTWHVQCDYLGSGAWYELAEAFEIQAADEAV
jgi:hypothetical protein